nr:retrotransposon protein, putative, Ty1-copia subclass [Tanacetum cinerariifolium]
MSGRIVLSIEDKLSYLEQPILPAPVAPAGQHVAPKILLAHNAWIKGSKKIVGLMLMTMEPEIQQNLEPFHAHEMLREHEEGQSVSSYVLKIKGYINNLERLGHPVTLGFGVSPILIGLRKEYDGFVQNYNMHNMGKTINELHAMLKLHEQTLPKNNAPALNAIRSGKVQKGNKHKKLQSQMAARGQNHGKGKNKQAYAPKPKIPPPPKREDPTKDSICHECGIFIIELNIILNRSWIYDTGCGTHICNTTQGLRASRKLKPGALSLYVGNGQREAVEAIGVSNLCLLSGLEIVLNNCHYAPSITRGVISVSRLYEDDFVNRFMERKPYTHQVERAKDLLGLIHTDVCGPFKIMSRQEASYFVTFTDDFRRYGYVYLLKHKHEVFENFKVFQKEVENQLGKTIKSLRSDRGGEYMSQEFLDHLKDHGIIAHRTPPYTPQHNGVSERRNRTLLDMNSLINQEASGSPEDLEIIQEEDTHPSIGTSLHHEEDDLEIDKPQSDIIPIRRSTRTRHASDRMCLYIDAEEHELRDLGEPTNYKAALLDPESKKWLNAMNVEMQSMKDNEVCVLIELPPNGKVVGSKWLFKKKTDMDGNVHTYKAHLVEKGYTQTPGIDYEETFSPVADIKAIKILIAIAAYYDYEIWQMDVKTSFLNRYLNKEVYMEQPDGFVNPKYLNRVCKLKRSIYGLKQASRQWNKRFDDEIKKFGFPQNRDESCVYLKASGSNITFLILYVDDILIMGNNIPMLQSVKSYLGRCFAMKDLSEATYILGIKIYRDRSRQLIG